MNLNLNEIVLRKQLKITERELREIKLQELKEYARELCIDAIPQLQDVFPYLKLSESRNEIIIKPFNSTMHDYNVYFHFGYEYKISITVDRDTKYYKYYHNTTKVEMYKNIRNMIRELASRTLSFYESEKFGINQEIDYINRKLKGNN